MKLSRVLTISMSGDDVTFLQTNLKNFGFLKERIDGYFGQNTLVAVTNFQRKMNIKADGVVGSLTWSKMMNYGKPVEVKVVAVPKYEDIPLKVSHIGESGFKIYDCLLSDDEYIRTETRKETIYLHHTAGGSRPDWTVGGWEKDTDNNGNSLKVATAYVIGRKSSSSNESIWDGKIIRTFDDRYWAYHLGLKQEIFASQGVAYQSIDKIAIGIEICNWGPLDKRGDKYYNYVDREVSQDQVCELPTPYKGHKYYHAYTDAQIQSVKELLEYWKKIYNIPITYNEKEMWDISKKGLSGIPGVYTHNSYRKDKSDISPQPKMIAMLKSL